MEEHEFDAELRRAFLAAADRPHRTGLEAKVLEEVRRAARRRRLVLAAAGGGGAGLAGAIVAGVGGAGPVAQTGWVLLDQVAHWRLTPLATGEAQMWAALGAALALTLLAGLRGLLAEF